MLIIGLVGDSKKFLNIKWNIMGPMKYFRDEDLNILYFSIEYDLLVTTYSNMDLKSEKNKCLLILLTINLAHIIIVFIPTGSFDIMYLKRLQIAQNNKKWLTSSIIPDLTRDVLSAQSRLVCHENIVQQTLTSCINHSKPPRLVIAFTKCTSKLCGLKDAIDKLECSVGKAIPEYKDHDMKSTKPLKRLAHVVEDEIYQTLKSASFFAQPHQLITLPTNQEFVFIYPPLSSNNQTTHDNYGYEGGRNSSGCTSSNGNGEKLGAGDFLYQTSDLHFNYACEQVLESIKTEIEEGVERRFRGYIPPTPSPLHDFHPLQTGASSLINIPRFLTCEVTKPKHELALTMIRELSGLHPGSGFFGWFGSDYQWRNDVEVQHEFSFYYDELSPNIVHPETFSKFTTYDQPLDRILALNWFNYAKLWLSITSTEGPTPNPEVYGCRDNPRSSYDSLLNSIFSRLEPLILPNMDVHLARSYSDKLPPVCTVKDYNSVVKPSLPPHYLNAHGRAQKIREVAFKLESQWFTNWYKKRPCETTSMSGHPCLLKYHNYPLNGARVNEYDYDIEYPLLKITDEYAAIPSLKVSDHKSESKCLASCACGSTITIRLDPFTAKEGNWDFYEQLRHHCCAKYKIITGRCDDVIHGPEDDNLKAVRKKFTQHLEHSPLQILKVMEPQACDVIDLRSRTTDEGESVVTSNLTSCFNSSFAMTYAIILPPDNQNKQLIRYDLFPLLLCPKFSSWYLTYYGPMRSYNIDTGLDMPNFLPGKNFLLPWYHIENTPQDIAFRTAIYRSKPNFWLPQFHEMAGKPLDKDVRELIYGPVSHTIYRGTPFHLFCGLEYECPMGHRFITGDPYGSRMMFWEMAVGNPKRGCVNTKMESDMPIWVRCESYNHKRFARAQLTRLYVVVPNTPAKIHLNVAINIPENHISPRPKENLSIPQNSSSLTVEAIESCDKDSVIFYPDIPTDKLILHPNSFWSLKFPYVYCSHLGTHLLKRYVHEGGHLLKNIFDCKI